MRHFTKSPCLERPCHNEGGRITTSFYFNSSLPVLFRITLYACLMGNVCPTCLSILSLFRINEEKIKGALRPKRSANRTLDLHGHCLHELPSR